MKDAQNSVIYLYSFIFLSAIVMNWRLFVKLKLPVLVAGLTGVNLTVFVIYQAGLLLALMGHLTASAVAFVLAVNILISGWFGFKDGLVMPKVVNLRNVAFGLLAVLLFVYLTVYNFLHYNVGNIAYSCFSSMLGIENNPFPQNISYGADYLLPFIYQKFALVFLIFYLSAADPITYLLYFAPVLWTLVQMGILIGSYAGFRAIVGRPLPALLLSLIFVHCAVAMRFLFVVGESYGWVSGFGFVSLAVYLLKHDRKDLFLWLAAGISLFVTINVHGVAAFISLLLVSGYFLCRLRNSGWRLAMSNWRYIGMAVLLLLTLIGMGKVVIDHPSDPEQKALFELNHVSPREGMVDYGLVYKNILTGSVERPVVGQAPYYPWPIFFKTVGKQLLDGFTLLTGQPAIMFLLLGMLVFLIRCRTPLPEIWVFGAVLAGIFCLSVYLNSKSNAAFPALIITRRLDHHSRAVALLLSVSIIIAFLQRFPKIWNEKVLWVGIAAVLCFNLPNPKSVFCYHPGVYPEKRIAILAEVIKGYSAPGYGVITNLRTINVVGFATGKQVVSEGRGPYQQYGLMKKIVSSIDELRHFFQYPTLSFLQRRNIDLVIVFEHISGLTLKFASINYENLIPLISRQPYLKLVYQNEWMRAFKVVDAEVGTSLSGKDTQGAARLKP